MKEIGIGLLGFGTVGAGVVAGLQQNGDLIAERLGVNLVVRKIADVDLERDRGVKVDPALLTRDAVAVIEDPRVDIVVELIGGTGVAKDLIVLALERGKPVVTANKALLASCGGEIFELADRKRVDLYFGASVGGGMPIVRVLRQGLIANQVDAIHGILNGTCNYILTRMEKERVSFEAALAEAQKQGYAEADPALDIDGLDTAHKAAILASIAYGFFVPLEHVYVEGIRNVGEQDIQYALDLGYRIKLLAVVKRHGTKVEVRVHPTMVPLNHMLASVSGVYNAVMVKGDLAGSTLYYGRGAGREPTASTVIGDIADIARNLMAGAPRRFKALAKASHRFKIMEIGDVETRYYLRLTLLDKPGVLAQITSVLGEHEISLASVLQKEAATGAYVPVVIITHRAKEKQLAAALKKIDVLPVVGARTVKFRIEDHQ